ncbi:ATP-grasp domain-containing protein [Candidatus Kaiserbacteria bacterium]|nr:ATP-grasp domain-containing protein [Candidatus Kaiserbacteria bacterium]
MWFRDTKLCYTSGMIRMVVGILRGGTSSEYAFSLKTGAALLAALPDERYEVRDIFIDRNGTWYLYGAPTTPARALSQVDVVLNALHGGAGEDGTIQRLLVRMGIPFAGSDALGASKSLHKTRAKEAFAQVGIRMPQGVHLSRSMGLSTGEMARAVFAQFGPPYMVKPPSEGASHGVLIAQSLGDLPDAIGDTIDSYGTALVEEYIIGREATVGIIERFRGKEVYALPPAAVIKAGKHITHAQHQLGAVEYQCPSPFSHDEKYALEETARLAHRALGLSHFSRADFILNQKGVPYLLEVDAHPHLFDGAAFPKMLETVGSSVGEFAEHAIRLARSGT